MLIQTAPVGQAVIRSAILLEKNYSVRKSLEDIVDEVENNNAKCRHCHIPESSPDFCYICKHQKIDEVKAVLYYNEKSTYGYRTPLNRTSILLFLWLHFNNPDKCGLVRMVDTEDAAAFIGCTQRTVVNNLKHLEETGYIIMRKLDIPGYYDVCLSEYKSYFKRAKEGGRGYIVMSLNVLEELMKQKDINSLRLAIRAFLMANDVQRKNGTAFTKTYKELKRCFPEYVTLGQIKGMVHSDAFRNIFHVCDKKKFIVSLRIQKEYDSEILQEIMVETCKNEVQKTVNELNRIADETDGVQMTISKEELLDIGSIGARYAARHVVQAITDINKIYVQTGLEIENLGALVRTFAKQHAEQEAFKLDDGSLKHSA